MGNRRVVDYELRNNRGCRFFNLGRSRTHLTSTWLGNARPTGEASALRGAAEGMAV